MEPKKGRKGRKIGKGVRKLSHSKWGKYAALFDYNTMVTETLVPRLISGHILKLSGLTCMRL
jgi:hypothetical protein